MPKPKKKTPTSSSNAPTASAAAASSKAAIPPVNKAALAAVVAEQKAIAERKVGAKQAPARGAADDKEGPSEDINELWAKICADPESAATASLIDSLSEDQVNDLQNKANPYRFSTGDADGTKRIAAVSFTNLREKYLSKFNMTALVGFLYQMLKEHAVPAEARRWVPKRAASDAAGAAAPDAAKLLEQLKATEAIAQAAADAKALEEKLHLEALDAENKAKFETDSLEIVDGVKLKTSSIKASSVKASDDKASDVKGLPGADVKGLPAADVKGLPAAGADVKAPPTARERAARLTVRATAAREAQRAAAARAAGLLYAATRASARIGLDMEKRIDAVTAVCHKYPETKSVLDDNGVRADAGSAVEMPAEQARGIIVDFVNNWFKFDVTQHVKSAHDQKAIKKSAAAKSAPAKSAPRDPVAEAIIDSGDPERLPLEALAALAPAPEARDAAAVAALTTHAAARAAGLSVLRQPALLPALSAMMADAASVKRFRDYLLPLAPKSAVRAALENIPPQDTFHRLEFYTAVNFEELRTVTETLYHEKPDIEAALAVWKVFEGPDADADFKKYCRRHEDDAPASLMAVSLGSWTVLGDFKANRERVDFYNASTEVIERILDRHASDARLGGELMRKRVVKAKSQNIRNEGPDAEGLKNYRSGDPARVSAAGGQQVISAEDMKRLEAKKGDMKAAEELRVLDDLETKIRGFDAILLTRRLLPPEEHELGLLKRRRDTARQLLEVPENALQVDVFETSADGIKKSHFYTAAEGPKEAAADAKSPAATLAPHAQRLLAAESKHGGK